MNLVGWGVRIANIVLLGKYLFLNLRESTIIGKLQVPGFFSHLRLGEIRND